MLTDAVKAAARNLGAAGLGLATSGRPLRDAVISPLRHRERCCMRVNRVVAAGAQVPYDAAIWALSPGNSHRRRPAFSPAQVKPPGQLAPASLGIGRFRTLSCRPPRSTSVAVQKPCRLLDGALPGTHPATATGSSIWIWATSWTRPSPPACRRHPSPRQAAALTQGPFRFHAASTQPGSTMETKSCVPPCLPMIALAGCAEESRLAPVSTAFGGMGPSMSEPEPANSLPRGSSVGEALKGRVGNLENTRVGPATLGAARAAPSVGSRS